jgi:phage major head subunit gpT-like protein
MSVAGLQDQLFRANRNYRAVFREGFEAAEAKWRPAIAALAQGITSGAETEEYNFGDAVPRMAEFKGERNMAALGVQGWTLQNVEYDNGIWILRKDLINDRLGIYNGRIRDLAKMGVLHQLTLIRDLFNNGFSSGYTSYDGEIFFSNSHPLADSSSTNDNLTTGALSMDTFRAADLMLGAMKDSQGEEMGLSGTTLVFERTNRYIAREIAKQSLMLDTTGTAAVTNVVVEQPLQLLEVPGLTAGYWGVGDLSYAGAKPFILQEREGLRLSKMIDPDNPEVFRNKRYAYGADWYGAAGYAWYEMLVASTG